jgi:glycosyltransferase involved in cell wall biosynthesis
MVHYELYRYSKLVLGEKMTDLSILIPSRNEMFLSRTIQDILEHIEMDTEVIAVLDGQWANPSVPQHERVTLLHYPESIGQRAATNKAASIASGKYFMKVDAHCSFSQGFDRILIEDMQPDWTIVPLMRNLHAFDWVCQNGHRRYQGPSGPCLECGEPTTMDIVWIAKPSPQSTSYRFDNTMHFQYFGEFKHRPEGRGNLTETMSLQGSCWMMTREKYMELQPCDEAHGSWGQQGVEVACKTWLSGGRVICDQRTWYAHMFRTQGGDFGFPYPNPGIGKAREYSRNLWINNTWDKAIHPLSWLINKFAPVPDWEVSKGIIYYTDNQLDLGIMKACQEQLLKSVNGHRIVSVSLQPLDFGNNITLPLERGILTMFKQILTGLEELDCDTIFFCEHDVLYHPSHFDFVPTARDKYYYNRNTWKLRIEDGHALSYECGQTSGLCAYRDLLVQHYKQRVKNTQEKWDELGGNTYQFRQFVRAQGFEPGTHHRPESVDQLDFEYWDSALPNIDVRHSSNLTPNRWSKDQFRRKPRTWVESDEIPGWGKGIDIVRKLNNGIY